MKASTEETVGSMKMLEAAPVDRPGERASRRSYAMGAWVQHLIGESQEAMIAPVTSQVGTFALEPIFFCLKSGHGYAEVEQVASMSTICRHVISYLRRACLQV